ncbi:MAG: class I SAM-dependent RNA methyltransferase, partial [Chloroflexi bacterium]|nr:class I SAM-dependent RNA methyltransferase [Chloroflexota bacterium]
EAHARWCRAHVIEVLEPSPQRVAPRCRHFGACGGCHYQHLEPGAQPAAKQDIVRAQLERLGGFRDPPVEETVAGTSSWNTRNHIQFSLTPDGRLGFQAGASNEVIAIQECHLPAPALNELWPALQLEAGAGIDRLALRCAGDETLIVFHAADDPDVELELALRASAVWLSPQGMHVLAGEPALVHSVRGRLFRVSPASFFQAHAELTPALVDLVLRAAQPQPGQTAFDLYAGVGLFSTFLAELGLRLLAVEHSAAACQDFAFNLESFEHVDLYQASVEQALGSLDAHPDVVIVDPPRAGLGREVVEALLLHAPPRLVYVSCDPSTLARDGKLLSASGYRLETVTPIDLFPQTFHIETVSLWTR